MTKVFDPKQTPRTWTFFTVMCALAAAELPDGTVLQTPGSSSCGPRQRNGTPPVRANPRVESTYTRPNFGGYYGNAVCVALSRQVRQIGPSDKFAAFASRRLQRGGRDGMRIPRSFTGRILA